MVKRDVKVTKSRCPEMSLNVPCAQSEQTKSFELMLPIKVREMLSLQYGIDLIILFVMSTLAVRVYSVAVSQNMIFSSFPSDIFLYEATKGRATEGKMDFLQQLLLKMPAKECLDSKKHVEKKVWIEVVERTRSKKEK